MKKKRLLDTDNIWAETKVIECCNKNHYRQLADSYFSERMVLDSRAKLCAMSEPEVLNHIAVLLEPMYNAPTNSFNYMVGGHVVCRPAFMTYYGLKTSKLARAREMCKGILFRHLPYFARPSPVSPDSLTCDRCLMKQISVAYRCTVVLGTSIRATRGYGWSNG
jgi:hypothetical protein